MQPGEIRCPSCGGRCFQLARDGAGHGLACRMCGDVAKLTLFLPLPEMHDLPGHNRLNFAFCSDGGWLATVGHQDGSYAQAKGRTPQDALDHLTLWICALTSYPPVAPPVPRPERTKPKEDAHGDC